MTAQPFSLNSYMAWLLQQVRNVNPSIGYVEITMGLHADGTRCNQLSADNLFMGDTLDELLQDIRENEGMVAA